MTETTGKMLHEVAERIRQLRLDSGYSTEEMAALTAFSLSDYELYEQGEADLPFSFIHKCANVFGVEMMELLEGTSPRLTGYEITRAGEGQITAVEPGIEIKSIAPLFKNRKADPYWVTYKYSEEEQTAPIHQVTHSGQEFDIVLKGSMKLKIGEHEEILNVGDSAFYSSSNPHGMS